MSTDLTLQFNEDLYLDNTEILLDIICSRLNTVYSEDEMMVMDNVSLDDYTVIWPESLINDVLDDNLFDWKAIEKAENDTDEDQSNSDSIINNIKYRRHYYGNKRHSIGDHEAGRNAA